MGQQVAEGPADLTDSKVDQNEDGCWPVKPVDLLLGATQLLSHQEESSDLPDACQLVQHNGALFAGNAIFTGLTEEVSFHAVLDSKHDESGCGEVVGPERHAREELLVISSLGEEAQGVHDDENDSEDGPEPAENR